MKSFTGKLVLKFTAKVRSRADLERRCEKTAARAEHTIGCELWNFEQLVELPTVIPLGYYAVQLCTIGNPDQRQYAPPAEPEWKIVETMTKAKAAVRDYLERHDKIGGGNWGPESGRIWDHQGEIVACFTYNLRCWSPDGGREIKVK
jgi:hypothetical protein